MRHCKREGHAVGAGGIGLACGQGAPQLAEVPESPGPRWRDHAQPEGSRLFRQRHLPRHGQGTCKPCLLPNRIERGGHLDCLHAGAK